MPERYRILVIAEAANPEWVSVPLVGWSMATALREVADVHIVTQVRNAAAFTRAGLIEGRDFTAIDTERFAAPIYRLANALRGGQGKGWTMMTAAASLIYPYFERLVWRRFGQAIRSGDYDIVHRVTPLSPTTASSIALKCCRAGVPFVLGPLNGGLPWPKQFHSARRKEREWLSYVRGAYKLMPGRTRTLAASRVILAGSRHTASELPDRFQDRVVFMPENGIDPARFANDGHDRTSAGPLRLCFIGRLVPYKAPDIAIEAALPLLRDGRAHLHIIGDGPMRSSLVALAEREGVAQAVTFHGWVEHYAVQSIAARCAIFVFPSVREFGGGAVLEAMAMGLVPVVVAYGGPGELVTPDRGVLVPMDDREAILRDFTAVLAALHADPAHVATLGARARSWTMTRLTWSAKAREILEVYDWALGKTAIKPEPY